MKRPLRALALSTVILASLSACAGPAAAGGASERKPVEKLAPAPTPTPTPSVESDEFGVRVFSDRGNLMKNVGDYAGIWSDDKHTQLVAKFGVSAIQVDPQCTYEFPQAPANGHFVKVDLRIETLAGFDQVMPIYFDSGEWKAYNGDGSRVNDPVGNSYNCLNEAEVLPFEVGPGETLDGSVVLDVKDSSGILVFSPGGGAGWEWGY